jgi:transcriptional regulator GlxA family with amidase domain
MKIQAMKINKKTCYLFVFDGFADYETSLATTGIINSDSYQLKTISLHKEPVRSMSGITVTPDLDFMPDTDLQDIDSENTGMLLLPGGAAWEQGGNELITPLVAHCLLHGIPVAGICGATVFLAELGLLNRVAHTSNAMEYLSAYSKVYRGQSLYRATPSVKTDFLITANGTASVDFAEDIFATLGIAEEPHVAEWFQYFQKELA